MLPQFSRGSHFAAALHIEHLAVAAFEEAAEALFRRWLADDALPREFAAPVLDEELSAWFARSRVTRPGAYRLGRILRSAQAANDDAALQRVADRLGAGMRDWLGALLADEGGSTAYARLAADPGRVGLESLLAEIAKLERLRALALPPDLSRLAEFCRHNTKNTHSRRRDGDPAHAADHHHAWDRTRNRLH